MPPDVRSLRWRDVDPAMHRFDPEPARAIATEMILAATRGLPAARWREANFDREVLANRIDHALVEAYGPWAAGWRWSPGEGDGNGGPVHGWCCARDSMLRRGDPDAAVSIERVVGALTDLRRFLEQLATLFAELHDATADAPIAETVELAAAQILPIVVERTSAEDAWYSTFGTALGWYLESAGLEGRAIAEAVGEVVSGRFESWVEPAEDVARAACAELGLRVAAAAEGTPGRDALAIWCSLRRRAFAGPLPADVDGHRRFIEGAERERDPERSARMGAALDACRASAERGEPLTFERLAAWQAVVLGARADFRTTDAFAKGGRERYGIDADTRSRFCAALDEANDAAVPAPVRAARVYLDVCFFHPFADGNARAARLAMDHVLTRAGLALRSVEPLFTVARSALDARGAMALARLVAQLASPRA